MDEKLIEQAERSMSNQTSASKATIPKTFSKESTWTTCQRDSSLVEMYLAVGQFCGEVEESVVSDVHQPRWLTLAGENGCGKTHLAKEIRDWTRKHYGFYRRSYDFEGQKIEGVAARRDVCFVTADEMAQSWKSGDYGRAEDLRTVFMLIIDDFGSDRDTSGFLAEQWFKLLNARMGRWTVISTNLSLEHIKDNYDSRIASRMRRDRNVFLQSKAVDFSVRRQAS